MKIAINELGRFREVTFCDFEDEDVCAHSGLLDVDGAHDLADELQSIAQRLRAGAEQNLGQILLPFAQAA